MKFSLVMRLCVSAALLTILSSSMAIAAAPTDPSVRGAFDAIFAYCERIDPQDNAKFRQLQQAVLGHRSDGQDDGQQNSPDYRQSFDLVSRELESTPRAQGYQSCKAAVKS